MTRRPKDTEDEHLDASATGPVSLAQAVGEIADKQRNFEDELDAESLRDLDITKMQAVADARVRRAVKSDELVTAKANFKAADSAYSTALSELQMHYDRRRQKPLPLPL